MANMERPTRGPRGTFVLQSAPAYGLPNGIEINYRLEGNGDQTLVLVSGLTDEIGMWDLQIDVLVAARWRWSTRSASLAST